MLDKKVCIGITGTEDQHADMLTEPLSAKLFEKIVGALMNNIG